MDNKTRNQLEKAFSLYCAPTVYGTGALIFHDAEDCPVEELWVRPDDISEVMQFISRLEEED